MRQIPEEYIETVAVACSHLAEGARLAMFVVEMLGDEKFVVDVPDGFNVEITRSEDGDEKQDDEVVC
jgi:hypothetical protein